ncbi:MAG: 2-C-methyl-D-erythritol 4-phosphate cytidylyltransferase [Thermoleophilaceae bacterium]|nr:2-C-methyl-D-erythritol 4-phosphate cytidylyltransferase [Thermoleophilaceae bacterium]
MTVVGILPAAGSGERLGSVGPKAFVVCGGRPLLEWSLAVLREVCDRVVVAVPAGFETGGGFDADAERVRGGATRSASVRSALTAAPEATVVVVHDAARPLVTADLVRACVAGLGAGFDAAIAAAPMTDTVKEAAPDGQVVRTLDRSRLWRIQTPQVFRADALRRALDVDDATLGAATDDAMLVEAAGGSVRVVEAPADNLKVTRPVDLRIAEALLAARSG